MSSSNSNASTSSQTVGVVSEYTKIAQDTSPYAFVAHTSPPADTENLTQRITSIKITPKISSHVFVTRNVPALFEKGPASPTRTGRLSAPFTPVSSPLRKILSPRKSIPSSQPSSRRVSGGDLVQDLAASLQLSYTKGSHTGAGESSSRSLVVNPIDERRTPATSAKSLPTTNCSAHACWPVTPHSSPARKISYAVPMTSKKRLPATSHPAQGAQPPTTQPPTGRSSPGRLKSQNSDSGTPSNGEDVFQDSAQRLEAPAIASPLLSSLPGKKAEPSSRVTAVVNSPVERDITLVPVTVAVSEPEGATRVHPISVTEEPKLDNSSSEDSVSLSDEKPSQRRKRTQVDDDEETDEAMIGPNVNKRLKCNIPIFNRTATTQGDIYGLDPLFEGEGEFHLFDSINNVWMIHGDESKEVDDPLTRGSDSQSEIKGALPISLEWDECESQTSTAAAPLSADELYADACAKLRAYKAHIDLGANANIQGEARDEMASAWRRWHQRSSEFIGMNAVRQYGEALDKEGRLAIADALGVESTSLLAWIEEPLTPGEKEEKRGERKAALASKNLASGSTSDFLDLSLYINFEEDEDDANNSIDNDLYTLVYAPPILPPLIPLIPSAPAILPHHVPLQHVVAPVAQASSSAVAFSKTPEDLVKTGPLPKWAKGVLYCSTPQALKQWMDARTMALAQKADVLGDKEKWLLDELNGPPRSNLTRGEMRIRSSTRAFNGLPEDQKPVLLHGKAAVKDFTNSRYEREFVVVCRTSFSIDESGVFDYRTQPCGHVVTSHDILIRHVQEKHFAKKRKPTSKIPAGAATEDPATPDTPVGTPSTSASDASPDLSSKASSDSV
ncbi:hypothetical protein FRC20_003752 [Serendipita sp. 405]|nr:hypothetical protein FRC16_010867 [Serendipita sp. 398]KAG8868240.1 hypothetical protein FRC20_003752 [Serendipita sp. 405]